MPLEGKEIVPRILRDMNEGVLVLDTRGVILYLNEKGRELLGRRRIRRGKNTASPSWPGRPTRSTTPFISLCWTPFTTRKAPTAGRRRTRRLAGDTRHFSLTSSFLFGEEPGERAGVVVVFSDITELVRVNRQRKEASTVFAVLMICVCVYLFLWSLLRYLNIEPPGWVMNLPDRGDLRPDVRHHPQDHQLFDPRQSACA